MIFKAFISFVILFVCGIMLFISGHAADSATGTMKVGPIYSNGILLANRQFSVEYHNPDNNISEAFLTNSDENGYVILDDLALGNWIWRIGCSPQFVENSSTEIHTFGEGEYKDKCTNVPLVLTDSLTERVNKPNIPQTRFWGGSVILFQE